MSLKMVKPFVHGKIKYKDFSITVDDYGETKDILVLTHKKEKIKPIVVELNPGTKLTYSALKKQLEAGPIRYEIVKSLNKLICEANFLLEEMRKHEDYSSYKERYINKPRASLE